MFEITPPSWRRAGVWSWASQSQFSAVAAAGQLRMNMGTFQRAGYGPWGQLTGALRAFNHGFAGMGIVRAVDQTGISAFANADTQYNNYVTSILAIARDCFGWHPGS